jgi:hypothetical protein
MTALRLDDQALDLLANGFERLPRNGVDDEAAQGRIVRALIETAEHYSAATVHIEIELDESAYVESKPPRRRTSDLELVLELAERFLDEGALADKGEAARHPYRVAIARLRKTTPELAG